MTGKLSVEPSSEWVPFSNEGRLRQRKERDGLRLSSAVPKIQWDSNPNCPYGYKAMRNLPFFTNMNRQTRTNLLHYLTFFLMNTWTSNDIQNIHFIC